MSCSCIDFGLASHFAGADIVFEAVSIGSRLIAVPDTLQPQAREITLLVGRVYKGELPSKKIIVRTRSHGLSCGARLPIGGRYLVFSRSSSQGSDSVDGHFSFTTSLCSGNKFYPFWRFSLRSAIRKLSRGDELRGSSRWARNDW